MIADHIEHAPLAVLTGGRCAAELTYRHEVIVTVDDGPLPAADVLALGRFLALVRLAMGAAK